MGLEMTSERHSNSAFL